MRLWQERSPEAGTRDEISTRGCGARETNHRLIIEVQGTRMQSKVYPVQHEEIVPVRGAFLQEESNEKTALVNGRSGYRRSRLYSRSKHGKSARGRIDKRNPARIERRPRSEGARLALPEKIRLVSW